MTNEEKDREPSGQPTDSTLPTPGPGVADPMKVMRRDYEVGNWDYNPWGRMS